jgi:hypothetical protein
VLRNEFAPERAAPFDIDRARSRWYQLLATATASGSRRPIFAMLGLVGVNGADDDPQEPSQ